MRLDALLLILLKRLDETDPSIFEIPEFYLHYVE
jgi:hypothetical protein